MLGDFLISSNIAISVKIATKRFYCYFRLWKGLILLLKNLDKFKKYSYREISEGGICFIDLDSKLRSLKAAWVSRPLKTKQIINDFVNSLCRDLNVDITYVANTSEANKKNMMFFRKCRSSKKEVVSCLNISKQKITLDTCTTELFLHQTVWSNRNITHKGKSFCFSNWVKRGTIYIKHLFNENRRLKPYTNSQLLFKIKVIGYVNTRLFKMFLTKNTNTNLIIRLYLLPKMTLTQLNMTGNINTAVKSN